MCRRFRFWGMVSFACGVSLILSNFIESVFLQITAAIILIVIGLVAWKY